MPRSRPITGRRRSPPCDSGFLRQVLDPASIAGSADHALTVEFEPRETLDIVADEPVGSRFGLLAVMTGASRPGTWLVTSIVFRVDDLNRAFGTIHPPRSLL